jgi:poly-gamma-glutamate synthesis protein (capsule biosynthesis protein)
MRLWKIGRGAEKFFLLALASLFICGCARPKKAGEVQTLVFSAGGELRPLFQGAPLFEGRKGKDVLSGPASYFLSRDVVMSDFTGALDLGCQPLAREPLYRWQPEWLPLLSAVNIKVLNLADDHSLDCGREALQKAMNSMLAQGFYISGAGRNQKEARAPVYLTQKGVTVSIANFLLAPPPGLEECGECTGPSMYDRTAMINALAEMKGRAQHHVLVLHFAERELPVLSDQELAAAREAIDFGADLVIGYGPGSAGGIHRVRGTWVIGSMGRICGDAVDAPLKIADGFILSAEFTSDKTMNLRLSAVELVGGRPELLRGDQGQNALARLIASADAEVRDNVKLIGDILYLK